MWLYFRGGQPHSCSYLRGGQTYSYSYMRGAQTYCDDTQEVAKHFVMTPRRWPNIFILIIRLTRWQDILILTFSCLRGGQTYSYSYLRGSPRYLIGFILIPERWPNYSYSYLRGVQPRPAFLIVSPLLHATFHRLHQQGQGCQDFTRSRLYNLDKLCYYNCLLSLSLSLSSC